ncbi:MAG: hypothetical protein KKH52_00970 [Nanoarchaeota archaeon]|nr:hypothetical protein [Nanoarchaeota archaeon]
MKKYILLMVLLAILFVVGCTQVQVAEEAVVAEEPAVEENNEVSWGSDEEEVATLSGDVEILDKAGFSPAEASVRAGSEVVFVNKADRSTVLTFQKDGTQMFTNSDLVKPGEGVSLTFEEGTYTYWTTGYGVKGKLVVE